MHLALFVWMDDYPHKRICKYPHLVNWNYPCKYEHDHLHLQTKQHTESLQTGKECEYEELRFRRGLPLVVQASRYLNSKLKLVRV